MGRVTKGGRARKDFWDQVWRTVPPHVALSVVEEYHNVTVRRCLALGGKAEIWAKEMILQDEENAASLSDRVYDLLGHRTPHHKNYRGAAGMAILARRHSYAAEIQDDKYDEVPEHEIRSYFKRCGVRAERELLEDLEEASGEILGRPE